MFSLSAAEALVEECTESLGDPDVTNEDFLEIYGEMRDWFGKVRESTAYMSDIITAIKGQAANIGTDENVEPDILVSEKQAGDRWLICSDGLTNCVTDAEIREHLLRYDLPLSHRLQYCK